MNEFEFKADMKRLLQLIVHSLYTNPEIFLRELVSNSSDALGKLRFKSLTDSKIIDPEAELRIDITLDKDAQTFAIEDSGVGMTKEDLVDRLGAVASSGTIEFLQAMKESGKDFDANMIGRFGVGFYSVFMVADEVSAETRAADEGSQSYKWTSAGQDKFTIEEIDREKRGTKVYFKLKDDFKEFADEYTIKNTLKKYSNFVDYPIYVNGEKVNSISALWHKKKDEISEDEFNEFYKFISNDFQAPLGHLHLSIEGATNFKALLFVPQSAPPALFRDLSEQSLHLYSGKVFIQNDAKDLLPDYLKFVKGVVDTEDLPLNVSREVTQNSPVMTKIRNVLTGKILTLLEDWAEKEKDKYEKFYKNFRSIFNLGVNSDYANRDRIKELLRYESSELKKDELTSLNGCVSRMDSEQKEIYYLAGDSRDAIERNPNLEYFRKKGIEVLFLTDPVDVFTFPYLNEYDGKLLKSIDSADIELSAEEESEKPGEDAVKTLIELFKKTLGDKVEDVVESKRLVESPATLVVGKEGMNAQMERITSMLNKDFSGSKRILEVNMSHPLVKNLSRIHIADVRHELLESCILQIYEGALLREGYLKSPGEFVDRMNRIMEEAVKNV